MAETSVVEGDQRIAVTVSAGGSTYSSRTTESAEGLVAQADAALYEAKAAGRDRVMIA